MSDFTVYTDKATEFDFKVEIEGASLSDARARLVFENVQDGNYVLDGKVNKDGTAFVSIPKLKGLLEDNHAGNMRLEMIVEDSFFEPWSGTYNVKASKKVMVSETSADRPKPVEPSKPRMKITINSANKSPYDLHIESVAESLIDEGITPKTLLKKRNKSYLFTLVEAEFNKDMKELDSKVILQDIVHKMNEVR